MFRKRKKSEKFTFKFWLQSLFQGIIVVAPVVITLYAVWWIFTAIDGFLPNFLNKIFPNLFEVQQNGIPRIPGLGFIITLLLLILIGSLSRILFINKLVSYLDHLLEKTPGIKLIYTSVKDFLEAFGGTKKKFNKPVLVNVDGADIWRLGFITQDSGKHFGLETHVAVYVPHSYAISGITYFVPAGKIKPIEGNVSAAEVMKFAVSGGVTELEHH